MRFKGAAIAILYLFILSTGFLVAEAREKGSAPGIPEKGTTPIIPDEGYSYLPEFTTVGAFVALAGAGAYALLKRKR